MTTAALETDIRAILANHGDLTRKDATALLAKVSADVEASGAAAEHDAQAALAAAQAAAAKAASLSSALAHTTGVAAVAAAVAAPAAPLTPPHVIDQTPHVT